MAIKYKVEISHEEGFEDDGRWELEQTFDTYEEAEEAAIQDSPWVGRVFEIEVNG